MAAAYRPDPGGVFDSDVHRRVLANLPAPEDTPIAFEYAIRPILEDDNVPYWAANDDTLTDLKQVLDGLVAAGYASYDAVDRLVQRTAAGTDALAAPSPHERDDLTAEEVTDREAANDFKADFDARRQAQDRAEANAAAVVEIQAAIEEDTAVLDAPEPDRPTVSDPKAAQVLAAIDEVQASDARDQEATASE